MPKPLASFKSKIMFLERFMLSRKSMPTKIINKKIRAKIFDLILI
jgi:hypothetical protein